MCHAAIVHVPCARRGRCAGGKAADADTPAVAAEAWRRVPPAVHTAVRAGEDRPLRQDREGESVQSSAVQPADEPAKDRCPTPSSAGEWGTWGKGVAAAPARPRRSHRVCERSNPQVAGLSVTSNCGRDREATWSAGGPKTAVPSRDESKGLVGAVSA